MKQQNALSNGISGYGNPPVSPVPAVNPSLSELPGETMNRILDLEFWGLDAQASFDRYRLPKTSLLPVSFPHSNRWGDYPKAVVGETNP